MAISFLFKIGTTDVTGHVVQNTYQVNNLPVYKTYEDANGESHRRFIRNKMRGNCQMVFKDVDDYAAFKTLIDNNTSATNFSVLCTLYDNISGTAKTSNYYLDFKLTAMQTAGLKEYMKPFDVTIEER